MDGPALPRSIRWRLQIGVWSLPDTDAPDSEGSPIGGDRTWTLHEILERNHDQVEIQRGNYNLLVEMMQEIMEQDDQPYKTTEQGEVEATPAHIALVPADTDIDPLTALLKERDAQEQRLHELDLKYRTRRARRKRGVIDCESDRGDTYSVSTDTDCCAKRRHNDISTGTCFLTLLFCDFPWLVSFPVQLDIERN